MRDRPELRFDRQDDILREYKRGFVGAYHDGAAHERLCQHIEDIGGYADGGAACRAAGFTNTGAGKLSIPYVAAETLYPGVLDGGRQLRGDCVSWSSRTTGLVSYCASLLYGVNHLKNDAPVASAKAIANGLFSTESWYWYRGYDGDGWSCSAAADVGMKTGGLVLRQNYPDLGIDLEEYSPSKAGRYGRIPPPGDVRAMTSKYLIKNATVCTTWEQVRDMLAQGYAISTCGGEAWSDRRDEHGVCNRTYDTWRHAIAAIGADDRDEVRKRYGSPLLLFKNSWDEYMTGGRKIYGMDREIPRGSYWSRWDDCASRTFIAFSTGAGWQANALPDWGLQEGSYEVATVALPRPCGGGLASGDGCEGRHRSEPSPHAETRSSVCCGPALCSQACPSPRLHRSIMPPAAAATVESDRQPQVTAGAEFLYRVAERFGLPVVILVLVLYWARTDIVQPLLDAHFQFIAEVVAIQKQHTAHVQEVGRKLDELIEITSRK